MPLAGGEVGYPQCPSQRSASEHNRVLRVNEVVTATERAGKG